MVKTDKLDLLAGAAEFDVCGYDGMRRAAPSPLRFIHKAAMPGGGCMSLFKVLLTNVCVNDCAYCVNRVGHDCHRNSFQPEELARLFMQMRSKRLVRGLFLSSGIGANATHTMEKMINTVEILRGRYHFNDYIHLKILPGASTDCIEQACHLATRVSINMEAPTAEHLAKLSSKKNLFEGILEPMRQVKKLMAANELLVPSGQTTQFVVGAAGETDRDILHTTEALYKEIMLRRVYYSAFRPVGSPRLEGVPPASPWRQHRLYQTDWLLRVYGFAPREVELALGESGNLALKKDPKVTIADSQPWLFPVDINKATREELLRVPGIGPTSAERIIEARKDRSINSAEQLKKMRVVMKRAVPYIWFRGMTDVEKQATFLPDLEETFAPPELSLAEVC